MSPADLAQRIAALDWSACSLQHQLAVTAAVLTLGKMESPVQYRDRDNNRPSGKLTECTVTRLPVKPRTCWTTLHHLDGRPWATSSHFGPAGAWQWIVESVVAELECSEDAVGAAEGEDGDDIVTVDGLPAYRIRHSVVFPSR